MAVTPNPVDLDSLVRNARRAQSAGSLAEAYAYYSEVNDLDPQNASGWIGRSETATDADEQLVSLAYAVALDETNRELGGRLRLSLTSRLNNATREEAPQVFEVGREFALVGLRTAANEIFQRATELDPTHVEAWLWRAVVAANSGEAQTSVGVAQALAPNDPNVRAALDWLESGPHASTVSSPDETPVQEREAKPVVWSRDETPVQEREAKPVDASHDETPVLESKPVIWSRDATPFPEPESRPIVVRQAPGARLDRRVAESAQALADAELMMARGDQAAAFAGFKRATELDPHDVRAWLGRAGAAQDIDDALASLNRVLELDPENAQARDARNSLRRQKLRRAQPPPENLATQQHPLRESISLPEPAPTGSGSRIIFVLLVLILLAALAALAFWYFGFFRLR